MNIKTLLSVAFFGALIFTSCKNDAPEVDSMTEENTTEMPASNTPEPMELDMQQPEQLPVQESPSALQQNATPAPATSQRLNPEHGQPNHRCDIAVGAPL
jgi:hypothetical protein